MEITAATAFTQEKVSNLWVDSGNGVLRARTLHKTYSDKLVLLALPEDLVMASLEPQMMDVPRALSAKHSQHRDKLCAPIARWVDISKGLLLRATPSASPARLERMQINQGFHLVRLVTRENMHQQWEIMPRLVKE